MKIGAALWATANQTKESGAVMSKTRYIGCKWGYSSLIWQPDSPLFDRARASGLTIFSWQNAILVNQTGRRFWDEMDNGYEYFAACLQDTGDTKRRNGGGPIWAIFDAEAVEREGWNPHPPMVDLEGYFFSGDTLAQLATNIDNEYQTSGMPPAALEETVARYNSFVDSGVDEDFGKEAPMYKIQTPPFYAAWSTPILHDCLTGLRTNGKSQVMDYDGEVNPGALLRRGVPGRVCAARARTLPRFREDRRACGRDGPERGLTEQSTCACAGYGRAALFPEDVAGARLPTLSSGSRAATGYGSPAEGKSALRPWCAGAEGNPPRSATPPP